MRRNKIFLQRWIKGYWPIYPVNQWIVLDKPVVFKDQRAGRIKWSNIEVQIHTITGGKDYRDISNFRDGTVWWTIKQAKSNWRSCRCLQVVSIHKFRVYKAVSRPRVNKSLEQDFIKMILVIRQECGQTLARVRVSQTKIVSIIISLQWMESTWLESYVIESRAV